MVRRFDSSLGSLHGIGLSDFVVLACLSEAPGARLRRVDLADRLGLTASAVTRIVGPLERIGLVARRADPSDARVGFAALTETGRERYREALETANGIAAELIPAPLRALEREALTRTLHRFGATGLGATGR
jgi:DNA-binding MarR family transcriptional regulator